MEQYQELLKEGHDLVWAGRYDAAAERYRQAIELQPDESSAYTDLGYALYEAGRLEEALRAYLEAEELEPGDPATLSRIGQIYGELGQTDAAAATFLLLADRYLAMRQLREAVQAWQSVIKYDPNNMQALRRLAEAYRRGERPDLAARALVQLARAHAEEGDHGEAIECCEQALALQPSSRDARSYLRELRGGRRSGSSGTGSLDPDVVANRIRPDEEGGQRALERMAEAFFADEGVTDENVGVEALRAEAIEYQTEGLYEEALSTYEQILEQQDDPAPEIMYNIGLMHSELMHYDQAIAAFERVRHDDEYALAANYAIGQCYQLQGRIDEGLEYFFEAVKIVDMQTVERDQADDMIRLYEGLAESFEAKGDRAQAEHFVQSLSDFLSSKGWEDKLREVRHRLGTITGDQVTLAELIEAGESEAVIASLTKSQEYAEAGHVDAALEECFWVLDSAPYYLPLHLQMGELLVEQDHTTEAVNKFEKIAEMYRIQGNSKKAIRTYERALEISPLEISVRSDLIELLVSYGEIDTALEHYIERADSYYQLARTEYAIEDLHEALRLAPRGSPDRNWELRIQRKLADIHLQRLDWPRAAAALEAIVGLDPSNTEVAARLAELYYTIDHGERARGILEDVTGTLTKRGEKESALDMWREVVEQRPDDINLKIALGEKLIDVGDTDEALEVWESALRPLVQSGQKSRAAALLRRMIGLHSPQEKRFRKMLSALLSRKT